MAKFTVNQAILQVLEKTGKPLTASAIYDQIAKEKLYSFNSANPENIVRTQLRRHSENLSYPKASGKKYFIFHKDGTYTIKR